MAPILSAEGEKINWINYKTGVKDLQFNLKIFKDSVSIAIEIDKKDKSSQYLHFEVLEKFKKQFETICGKHWQWEKTVVINEGKTCSRVVATLDKVSILNQSQWPEIISFFKMNLILLDEFWSNFKFAFDHL